MGTAGQTVKSKLPHIVSLIGGRQSPFWDEMAIKASVSLNENKRTALTEDY